MQRYIIAPEAAIYTSPLRCTRFRDISMLTGHDLGQGVSYQGLYQGDINRSPVIGRDAWFICQLQKKAPPGEKENKQQTAAVEMAPRYSIPPDIEPLLGWCWADVVDGGPASSQHWFNVWCFLGTLHVYNQCLSQQRWSNVGWMLGQSCRQWTNVWTALAQCLESDKCCMLRMNDVGTFDTDNKPLLGKCHYQLPLNTTNWNFSIFF